MQHEKIIKRPDGTQVKISVALYATGRTGTPFWDVSVTTKPKGKRLWVQGLTRNDVSVASKREVLEVKLELWEMIKPKLITL